MTKNIINPFGQSDIGDYEKLFKEFGVSKFAPLIKELPNPPAFIRRGIVFGHRDFGFIVDCVKKKKKFAVMTGIKPTNKLHYGSKFIVDLLVYLQKLGGTVYYAIADLEALADNGIPLEEGNKIAKDNIIDILALGLDPKRTKFYKQSDCAVVQKYGYVFSNNVTKNMMKAIYGDRELRLSMIALIQVADILSPQIEMGKIPTVVPVGFDQDPHMRLTRDIAKKHRLIPPGSIYIKFLSSLTGEPKMSKRKPEGMIYLSESPASAAKKIQRAFTGGRDTLEQQRRLGGRPEIDKIYELFRFGLIEDDKELAQREKDNRAGKILSREDKAYAVKLMTKFLKDHQKKRTKAKKSKVLKELFGK